MVTPWWKLRDNRSTNEFADSAINASAFLAEYSQYSSEVFHAGNYIGARINNYT